MFSFDIVREKREHIMRIATKHGAKNVRVFGSVARGESSETSDVDFLIDLEPGRSLFDLVAFLQDLEELLGKKVDVVTEDSIYWLLKRRIVKEAVPL
jgi:uncharacterized protein